MTRIVASFDANDPSNRIRPHQGQPYLRDFLAAHGIDWMLCHKFEVLADGDGSLRVWMFSKDIRDPAVPTPKNIDTSVDGWEYEVWGLPPVVMPLRAPVPKELQEA